MPRLSKKRLYLNNLRKLLRIRLVKRAHRTLLRDDDDSIEDAVEDAVDSAYAMAIRNGEKQRYLFRHSKYRSGDDRFAADLQSEVVDDDSVETEAAKMPWLNEEEFLHKYRMSRKSFNRLLDEIKDHPVFNPDSKTRKQEPVAHQLMVFLKFLGTEGSGGSNANQRHVFSIGYGTNDVYRNRVTRAILSLRNRYVYWPDEEERTLIAREIHKLYDFPHCVGIADGTLFPLGFEPQTEDAPDYSGRKCGYSISTMVVCDHRRRVRYYLSGYPGSAHDNRVFKGTALKKRPSDFFGETQYLIGDSAFENDWFMVAAFKKHSGQEMTDEHDKFNKKMARLRIISEHCIGMLKGRFPWLRQIRLVITEDVRSLKRILRLIDASVILHNMLICFGEEEREEWIDLDDFSDMDAAERAPYEDNDELNIRIPDGAPKDAKRSRLLNYFKEFFFPV
jgi:DDE superfamily endonuclease